jgi:tRNA (guanine26-N2/guanine27-N2)-dimethyltransferase
LSIAVLRTFVSKRKEEHEAKLSKRTKSADKASGKDASEPAVVEESNGSALDNEKSNVECEVHKEISQVEPCSISEEPMKSAEGNHRGELKPPKVLEVQYQISYFYIFPYSYLVLSNHFATTFFLDTQALSASGLRSLRYACEVEGIGKVVALDNDKGKYFGCLTSGSLCLFLDFEKTYSCTKWP